MSYKLKEKQLAFIIWLHSGKECELIEDQYSHHDAETENAILEFKVRDKYYREKMLEDIKFTKNLETAKKLNKAFLYVVWDPKGIWILDVTKHEQTLLKIGLTSKPMPASTHFNKTGKVTKDFYLIPENLLIKLNE